MNWPHRRISVTQARYLEHMVFLFFMEYEKNYDARVTLPISLLEVSETMLGFKVDYQEFVGRLANTLGMLIPDQRWIAVNEKLTDKVRRYTVAHEIAHTLIDMGKWQSFGIGDKGRLAIADSVHWINENIVDYIAGVLLMPPHLLLPYLGAMGKDSIAEDELSHLFGVSTTVVRIRVREVQWLWEKGYLDDLISDIESYHLKSPQRATNRRHRDIVVYIKNDRIGPYTVRRLYQLKQECESLHVQLHLESLNAIETLMCLNIVDGFIFHDGQISKDLIRDELSHHDSEIDFRVIDTRLWWWYIESRMGQPPSRKIFTRHKGGYLQRELVDINKYLEAGDVLKNRDEARAYIQDCHSLGKRVGVVTGCFDIMTNDHVRFLNKAKSEGDILVVGLENDNRIRAFKGGKRPVNNVVQRAEFFRSLKPVDFTFVIYGSAKLPMKPFYSKLHSHLGADYLAVSFPDPHLEDRKDEIEMAGGELIVFSREINTSTTSIVRQFLDESRLSEEELVIVPKRVIEELLKDRMNSIQLAFPSFRVDTP